MNSTYSKLSNASSKLSNRRIFPKPSTSNQGNDLFRIAAKIRQLQDDVKTILNQNSQIESKNKEIIQILQQLQYVVGIQQGRIDQLTACLRKDINQNESISQYQQDLQTVAQQINTLNSLIKTKNQQYQALKSQKQDMIYENMRLKQQSNLLMYTENIYHQQLDMLLQENEEDGNTFDEDLQSKTQIIFNKCRNMNNQIQQLKRSIQQIKDSNKERVTSQKQKRLKLQYEVKLLRQRKTDQLKRQGYFKGFYDEDRIQQVIDDMLIKQDRLRRQVAQQEQANQQLAQDWEQSIQQFQKITDREKYKKQEEIRLLNLQIEILKKSVEELSIQHIQVSRKLQISQTEGIQMYQFQEQMDSGLWSRIKSVQGQNLRLQEQYEQLSKQVQFLQKKLTL